MASTIIRNRDRSPLTRETIIAKAPTVYADAPHDSRSGRYMFVNTGEMLEALGEVGWHPVQVTAQVPRIEDRRGHAKHEIRLAHVDHGIDYGLVTGANHIVDRAHALSTGIEMVLINSHDGTSAIDLSLGLFRLICTNGLVVPDGQIDGYHVRHSAKWHDEVIEGTYRVLNATERVTESVTQMAGTDLPEPQRMLLAAHASGLRWPDGNAPVPPEQLLRPRRRDDSEPTAWNTLNVLQEHIIRGDDGYRTPGTRTQRAAWRHTRPITGIDDAQRINRGLWEAVHTLTTTSPADFAERIMQELAPADRDALLARMHAA